MSKKNHKKKTVFRTVKQKRFVTIDNAVFMDKRLTLKAKGLMGVCLTRPDDWDFHMTYLIKQSKDGRDSTYSALKELKDFGYIQQVAVRIEGKVKRYEYLVFEDPAQNPFDPAVWGTEVHITERDLYMITGEPQDPDRPENTPDVDKQTEESEQVPENPETENDQVPGNQDTENQDTGNPQLPITDIYQNGYTPNTDIKQQDNVVVEKVMKHWEEAFKTNFTKKHLTKKQAIFFLTDAKWNVEWTLECISNVAKDYIENKVDLEPIKASRYAIQHGGWQPRGQGKGRKEDSLPRAIRKAMEREENEEQPKSTPADPEQEARLRAKWNRMNQRLKDRGGTNENSVARNA